MEDPHDEWLHLWPIWLMVGGLAMYLLVYLVATALELLCRMLEQGDCPDDRKRR